MYNIYSVIQAVYIALVSLDNMIGVVGYVYTITQGHRKLTWASSKNVMLVMLELTLKVIIYIIEQPTLYSTHNLFVKTFQINDILILIVKYL